MSDPRENLPSASNLDAYELCPGRFQAEQLCPPEAPTAWGLEGDAIHAAHALTFGDPHELAKAMHALTDEQVETYAEGEHRAAELAKKFGPFPGVASEKRLWLTDGATRLFSGRFDRLYFDQSAESPHGLVPDFKTGRKEVPDSTINKQLRAYAVLVWKTYGLRCVKVAVVHRWGKTQSKRVAVYSEEHLETAHEELMDTLSTIRKPGAKRVAGLTQCQYCRAKFSCPEALAAMKTVAAVPEFALKNWEIMPVAEQVELFRLLKLSEKVSQAVLDKIKEKLLADPQSIPGLVKKDDTHPREVSDVLAAWEWLMDELWAGLCGRNEEAFEKWKSEVQKRFLSALSVSIENLTAIIVEITGEKKKEADERLKLLAPAWITTSTRSGAVALADEKGEA